MKKLTEKQIIKNLRKEVEEWRNKYLTINDNITVLADSIPDDSIAKRFSRNYSATSNIEFIRENVRKLSNYKEINEIQRENILYQNNERIRDLKQIIELIVTGERDNREFITGRPQQEFTNYE